LSTHQPPLKSSSQLPLSAALFTIFLCTLFGANAVAIKISLTGLGTFTAIGLRFTIAAAALFLWSKWAGKDLTINRKQLKQLLIVSSIFFVQMSCFYHGQSKTTASHGTLIANMLPFVVMILAHFFLEDDRINLQKILGLMLGFSGVVILFTGSSSGTSHEIFQGDLTILFAVLLWGCNVTYIKHIISEFQPLQITIFPMIFTIPLFFIGAAVWDTQPVEYINSEIIAAVLYQSLVTASFGFVMWNTLIQKYGATALHSFIFILPISGVFFGVLILKEPLSANLLGAIFFVTLGLLAVNYRSRQNN